MIYFIYFSIFIALLLFGTGIHELIYNDLGWGFFNIFLAAIVVAAILAVDYSLIK